MYILYKKYFINAYTRHTIKNNGFGKLKKVCQCKYIKALLKFSKKIFFFPWNAELRVHLKIAVTMVFRFNIFI